MNNVLRTSGSDLSRSLQKALVNSNVDQTIALKVKEAGGAIAFANRSKYPEIESSVSRLGPWSWAILFAAPSLWSGTFGSRNKAANQFVTHVNFADSAASGGLRGEP